MNSLWIKPALDIGAKPMRWRVSSRARWLELMTSWLRRCGGCWAATVECSSRCGSLCWLCSSCRASSSTSSRSGLSSPARPRHSLNNKDYRNQIIMSRESHIHLNDKLYKKRNLNPTDQISRYIFDLKINESYDIIIIYFINQS